MKSESEKYAKDCWAWSLGDCGGGISREHYVSQSVFPDQSIFVQGIDWCLDEAKEIRIETLTAKILCKRHNTALSELDATAGLPSIRYKTMWRRQISGKTCLILIGLQRNSR